MKNKGLIIGAAIALMAVGGFVGYRFLANPAAAAPPRPMMVEAGEFVTNLAGTDKRFIKIQIDVEAESERTGKEILSKSSQVRDQVLGVLRSKKSADLAGPDGMKRLSKDLAEQISKILESGKVLNIYFTDFAIQ